ncbi:3-hydroxyacyl-CoA dehydrogenase NAD-binding domain-containing protein [Pseudochelatococcus sp. B33]
MNAADKKTTAPVRYEVQDGVAFIVIDNPPVNAGSAAVRIGLRDAVLRLAADASAGAGVLIGAGKTFIAGSDIKEFGAPLQQPELPAVIAEIEQCPKPVVAAIHGAALGGGFELSLGCDARVAVPEALVGLPEVTLGMIPGAGGTQRLPRLTGIVKAIDLVVSGRRIKATEALTIGIIDRLIDAGDMRKEAAAFALSLKGAKRRLGALSVPAEDPAAIAAAEAAALRSGRGREAVREAVAAVIRAGTTPFNEALAEERRVFQLLRTREEAAALRYNFFAERAAARVEGSSTHPPRAIHDIGVVGAGTMGAGIAAVFAAAGFAVTLADREVDILDRAEGRIAQAIGDLVRSGRLASGEAATAMGRVAYTADIEALSDADLIIEAVFEDVGAKTAVMQTLGKLARPGAVIASNTSYLDLDMLAAASGRAGEVIGLHFFAPVHRMRLVEVVRGAKSLPEVVNTGLWVSKAIGKLPVIAGVGEGFIGNRIYARYRAQCEFMLEEGALPQEVDAAMEAFGFAMGPFAVSDLSSLDIAWAMRKRRAPTRDPRERYVSIADRLCEMGRLGRKTGLGWYDYADTGSGRGKADPAVTAIVKEAAAAHGLSRSFSEKDIQRRALGAIVNEAALVLEDGIARSAADIDLVLVNGYGFSKFRGGPLFLASRLPKSEVDTMLEEVAAASGFGFRPGNVHKMLEDVK